MVLVCISNKIAFSLQEGNILYSRQRNSKVLNFNEKIFVLIVFFTMSPYFSVMLGRKLLRSFPTMIFLSVKCSLP